MNFWRRWGLEDVGGLEGKWKMDDGMCGIVDKDVGTTADNDVVR